MFSAFHTQVILGIFLWAEKGKPITQSLGVRLPACVSVHDGEYVCLCEYVCACTCVHRCFEKFSQRELNRQTLEPTVKGSLCPEGWRDRRKDNWLAALC